MRILLSNDDGIKAEGISAMVKALCSMQHEVVVAAPFRQQSGMAHALTVRRKIEVSHYTQLENKFHIRAYMIDGTPTDCVKIFLEAIADSWQPELVISGINQGANLGTDVLYSGTVGAALEGYLHKIPSAAVSLEKESLISYEYCAEIAAEYLTEVMSQQEKAALLNINFPHHFSLEKPEFVFTKLGNRDYINAFQRFQEDGKIYYFMSGEIYDKDNNDATDIFAVSKGLVAVTWLKADMTDYVKLDEILS